MTQNARFDQFGNRQLNKENNYMTPSTSSSSSHNSMLFSHFDDMLRKENGRNPNTNYQLRKASQLTDQIPSPPYQNSNGGGSMNSFHYNSNNSQSNSIPNLITQQIQYQDEASNIPNRTAVDPQPLHYSNNCNSITNLTTRYSNSSCSTTTTDVNTSLPMLYSSFTTVGSNNQYHSSPNLTNQTSCPQDNASAKNSNVQNKCSRIGGKNQTQETNSRISGQNSQSGSTDSPQCNPSNSPRSSASENEQSNLSPIVTGIQSINNGKTQKQLDKRERQYGAIKRYRDRKKAELSRLRSEMTELTDQLSQLQAKATTSYMRNPSSWEQKAKGLRTMREEYVQENKRLRSQLHQEYIFAQQIKQYCSSQYQMNSGFLLSNKHGVNNLVASDWRNSMLGMDQKDRIAAMNSIIDEEYRKLAYVSLQTAKPKDDLNEEYFICNSTSRTNNSNNNTSEYGMEVLGLEVLPNMSCSQVGDFLYQLWAGKLFSQFRTDLGVSSVNFLQEVQPNSFCYTERICNDTLEKFNCAVATKMILKKYEEANRCVLVVRSINSDVLYPSNKHSVSVYKTAWVIIEKKNNMITIKSIERYRFPSQVLNPHLGMRQAEFVDYFFSHLQKQICRLREFTKDHFFGPRSCY